MTLSRKEKALIVILVLLIVLGFGTSMLILPRLQTLSRQTAALADKQMEQVDADDRIVQIAAIDNTIASAYDESVANAKRFLPHMSGQEIDDAISPYFTQYNITRLNMAIAAPVVTVLEPYAYQASEPDYPLYGYSDTLGARTPAPLETTGPAVEAPAEQPGASGGPAEPVSVRMTAVTVSFTAAYVDYKRFLDGIAGSGETIYVANTRIDGIADGTVTGTLTLEFYQMNKPAKP